MIVTSTEYLTFLQASGATLSDAGIALLTLAAPMLQQSLEKKIGYAFEQNTYVEYYPSNVTNNINGGDYLVGNWDMIGGRAVSQARDARARMIIGLNMLPVRSITEVRENFGAWNGGPDGLTFPYFPSTSVLPPSSYRADWDADGICNSGRLIRNVGSWARELRSIKVTYVAGWTKAEINIGYADLKLALLHSINAFYIGQKMRANAAVAGGFLTSESVTDHSKSFGLASAIGLYFENDFTFPPEAARIISRYTNMRMFFTGN